ncbi:hypothetical protein [Singapore grouper iridovirus]|nr:hypothetical protein [Singapore grouper iridovirus]
MLSREWLISRMKKHPKGGILSYKYDADLFVLLKAEIFPRERDKCLIVTNDARRYMLWSEYKYAYTVEELQNINTAALPVSFVWIETMDMETLSKRFMTPPGCSLWWYVNSTYFMELTYYMGKTFTNLKIETRKCRATFNPVISLNRSVSEIVEYETRASERFLFAVFTGEYRCYLNVRERREIPEESLFWPDVAYVKMMMQENSDTIPMLSAKSVEEMAVTDNTFDDYRECIYRWCPEYKHDLTQEFGTEWTSSLLSAIKIRAERDRDCAVVVVQTETQKDYAVSKLGETVLVRTYAEILELPNYALPDVVLIAIGNLSEYQEELDLCEKLTDQCIPIVLFKMKEYDFAEMEANKIYSEYEMIKYRDWLEYYTV